VGYFWKQIRPQCLQSGSVHHVTTALVTQIAPKITVIACRMSAKTPSQLTASISTHDVRVIAIVTGRSV
jgi:hypothetical protein